MAKITVNTDLVSTTATDIENLNKQLNDELVKSKKLIDDLSNSWTGEAYESTKSAFSEFAAKYFEQYKEVIDNYVKFLRANVSQGYFEVESQNINLGDAFK